MTIINKNQPKQATWAKQLNIGCMICFIAVTTLFLIDLFLLKIYMWEESIKPWAILATLFLLLSTLIDVFNPEEKMWRRIFDGLWLFLLVLLVFITFYYLPEGMTGGEALDLLLPLPAR